MSQPRKSDDMPTVPEKKVTSENNEAGIPEKTPAGSGEPSVQVSSEKQDKKVHGDRMNLVITAGIVMLVILAAIVVVLAFTHEVAAKGDRVSVYYTMAFENGTVIKSNMNSSEPIVFTLGNGSVLAGLENAVFGMSVDEVKTVNVNYTEAFGAYNPALVQTVNRTGPLANTTFVVGQMYIVHDKTTNATRTIRIVNVTTNTVTMDRNRVLAGQNLTFTIKLANVTKDLQNTMKTNTTEL